MGPKTPVRVQVPLRGLNPSSFFLSCLESLFQKNNKIWSKSVSKNHRGWPPLVFWNSLRFPRKWGKSDIFRAFSKIFRKRFYIVNINRFCRDFQGWYIELGYKECPLLGMISHTPPGGQPQNPIFIETKLISAENTEPISTKFSEVTLLTRESRIGKT